MDQHRWVNSWAQHTWITPHVHGDLCQSINSGILPQEGDFKHRNSQISELPLSRTQYCFTHGEHCRIDAAEHAGEINFSGLPCEENSKANVNRKFLNGRFANLYSCWGRRHKVLRTPLLILENTVDPKLI